MQRVISSVIMLIVVLILSACGSRELLSKASFAPDTISPDADGVQDATSIHYELGRQANVSIYVQDASEQRYYFRNDQPRTSGVYDVLFGGVIDGQLLPDGDYTWVIEAADEAGQTQAAQGKFAVQNGEKTPPQITKMSIQPREFTPNRDGISDRATINVDLNKPATLFASLQNSLCNGSATPPLDQPTLDCTPFSLTEKEGAGRKPGEAGLHEYDYDAGVDLGAEPPPDGAYVVTVRAEDNVGQVTVATDTLKIVDGGVPRAELVDGAVQFSARSLVLGQTLYFTLTVENYSAVPIRTSGPQSGYVYTNTDLTFNWPGFAEESGVWRVAIGSETMKTNYPFRWAVGGPQDLIVKEIDGKQYSYLPPGARAVITGGVTLTEIPQRNPANFFAALIHEDVEIAPINQRVDPQPVLVLK